MARLPVLAPPITEWYCPACKATDQTRQHGPHIRYHTCPKLRYLSAPMVRKGTAAKIEVHEWADDVGDEMVQRDPELNRPVISIETTRDNGNDLVILAPAARATVG